MRAGAIPERINIKDLLQYLWASGSVGAISSAG